MPAKELTRLRSDRRLQERLDGPATRRPSIGLSYQHLSVSKTWDIAFIPHRHVGSVLPGGDRSLVEGAWRGSTESRSSTFCSSPGRAEHSVARRIWSAELQSPQRRRYGCNASRSAFARGSRTPTRGTGRVRHFSFGAFLPSGLARLQRSAARRGERP